MRKASGASKTAARRSGRRHLLWKCRSAVPALVLAAIFSLPASAAVLRFPKGNLSLQDVVTAAADGDTVLVEPGTYEFFYDHLVILQERLTVKSAAGAARTILKGRGDGPVVSFLRGSKAVLDGFTITSIPREKVTDLKGGGIYCAPESAPVIINAIITDNSAVFGGGIYCDTLSAPRISGCTFTRNNAAVSGGAIFITRAAAVIHNNRFRDNRAGTAGGAIGSNRGSSKIINNIIHQNSAVFGGGISCDRSASIIYNNTLVENRADYGGGIVVDKGAVRLTNLILYHNRDRDIHYLAREPEAVTRPTYSLISDGSFRGFNGNIAVDPLFVDADTGDFHLGKDSPCKNTGNPDFFYEDPDSTTSDMGAYGGPGAQGDH